MAAITDIRLACFVRGETENDIFHVTINNNLTVDNLKSSIRNIRQDLHQKNFDLYEVDFFQPNYAIVSSVNSFSDSQGVFMDPQKKISDRFPTLRINTLIERPPYPQENGGRGSIHVLIYPQNE